MCMPNHARITLLDWPFETHTFYFVMPSDALTPEEMTKHRDMIDNLSKKRDNMRPKPTTDTYNTAKKRFAEWC